MPRTAYCLHLVLLVAACDRTQQPPTTTTTTTTTTAASVDASAAPSHVVDAATVATCTVTYNCSLSHPGLGSSFHETSVDLATCTKTLSSASRPWEDRNAPPRPGGAATDAASSSRTVTKITPEACAGLQKLALAITDDDARNEQESAQMDTTACTLTLSCPPAPNPVLSVQRQSLTGTGRVVQLISALQVAR